MAHLGERSAWMNKRGKSSLWGQLEVTEIQKQLHEIEDGIAQPRLSREGTRNGSPRREKVVGPGKSIGAGMPVPSAGGSPFAT